MAARKKPGVLWRGTFGLNGPTRPAMRKALREWLDRRFAPKPFQTTVYDPKTGRPQTKWVRLNMKTGQIEPAKKPAPKSKPRKPAAKKPASGRGASKPSKPSKPSRTSRTGATPQRRTTAAAPAPRRARPVPLADRVLRNPDGTLNGSVKDPAKAQRDEARAYAAAQRGVRQASKNAEVAGKRAEQLLGWQAPKR